MSELVSFILGGVVFAILTYAYLKYVRALDVQRYKRRWEEAVQLLGDQGQLSDEQIAEILTGRQPEKTHSQLPKGEGFSEDRRNIEIARAKKGLPPNDNLEGMFSEDIRDVKKARIQYGTELE